MPAPVYVAEIFPQFRLAAGTAVVNRYHSDKKSGRGIVSRLQGAFERGRVTAAPAVVFPEKNLFAADHRSRLPLRLGLLRAEVEDVTGSGPAPRGDRSAHRQVRPLRDASAGKISAWRRSRSQRTRARKSRTPGAPRPWFPAISPRRPPPGPARRTPGSARCRARSPRARRAW